VTGEWLPPQDVHEMYKNTEQNVSQFSLSLYYSKEADLADPSFPDRHQKVQNEVKSFKDNTRRMITSTPMDMTFARFMNEPTSSRVHQQTVMDKRQRSSKVQDVKFGQRKLTDMLEALMRR
jgi:hypothetical protein